MSFAEVPVCNDNRSTALKENAIELFVYPGDGHLFTDASLPDHEPASAALVTERVLAFLAEL